MHCAPIVVDILYLEVTLETMVVHACIFCTQEAKAGELQVQSQFYVVEPCLKINKCTHIHTHTSKRLF